jgi:hypothetical protein
MEKARQQDVKRRSGSGDTISTGKREKLTEEV